MVALSWYFDFLSPFSYLQLSRLHELPADRPLALRPVLLAALLDHWGTKGPAEVPGKRRFTYRHAQWLAARHGIPMRMPPAHPFNPLRPLRLACALGPDLDTVRVIFHTIWAQGHDPSSPEGWQHLTERLQVADADSRIEDPAVKEALRANTAEAIAAGVFGVPTVRAGDELFWGFDATDMVLDYLADPGMLQTPEMRRISDLPVGVRRRS